MGVRVEDIHFPKTLNVPHESMKLKWFDNSRENGERQAMSACIGPLLQVEGSDLGLVRPRVDRNDPVTTLTGVIRRFAVKPPNADMELVKRLEKFVDKWLKDNLTPLSSDSDDSFETWINGTNYNNKRKDELRRVNDELTSTITKDERIVNMFVKDEGYDSFKNARGINSRSDEFKVRVGPIFKLIEKEVFKHPCFIKKIPINERAEYIKSKLGETGPFLVSDYTAYESLFTREMMKAVEMQLYAYMTSELSDVWYDSVSRVLLGVNRCESKNLVIEVLCKRMSGEMCTSLGNGFSNWMFINFICSLSGTIIDGVVEGDDGLFKLDGYVPRQGDFEQIGLNVKLEEHSTIGTTSFCGMLFHEDAMDVVTDPRKVLAEFGWFKTKYTRARPSLKKMLLRAKSYSLKAQYPNCPVVRALAEYGLRMTRSHSLVSKQVLDSMDVYKRSEYLQLLELAVGAADVHIGSRILVEEQFNISISEQLVLERYFNDLDSWHWQLPISSEVFSDDWAFFGEEFVLRARPNGGYPFATGSAVPHTLFPEAVRCHLRA